MVLLILMMVAPYSVLAQRSDPEISATQVPDTIVVGLDDDELEDDMDDDEWDDDDLDDELEASAALTAEFDSLENSFTGAKDDFLDLPNVLTDKDRKAIEAVKKEFVPDPQRALWLSFVIPGGGQIYNRKYWKLPIFYGGFLGCMYAFTWNQQMYMDYSQAYLDIMDDNPNTNSYKDMFPPSYDIDSNVQRFQTVFKNRKDRYRRWRDLSTFCFIGVYALSIIDAYVDAHMSVFDISPDLSLQWGPTSIEGPHQNIGLGATLHF